MKKIITLLLAALIVFSLCGCGGDNVESGVSKKKKGNTSHSTGGSSSESADTADADGGIFEDPLSSGGGKLPEGRLFTSGDFILFDLGDGTAYLISYTGNESEVVFPSEAEGLSVTGIWIYSLDGSNTVRKVTIPASIKYISYSALTKPGLMQIEVDDRNPYYKSINGVLYSKDGKTLICFPADHCSYTGMRKFILPDSVEVISAGAFWYDNTLMVVEVGDGNKAFKDVDGVVYSKDGKTVVWFPAGKPYTFYHIPDGVTGIANYAFVCARNVEQFTIPASVEKISPTAFLGCTALMYLTVDEANNFYSSDKEKVLYNKDKTELVFYPPSNSTTTFSFLDSLTKINRYACFGCKFMYKAPLPEGVTEIGFNAFKNCDWLREADLPAALKSIGQEAFADCRDLTAINYSGTVSDWEKIEKGANWNAGKTPEITVHCSDGDVAISKD